MTLRLMLALSLSVLAACGAAPSSSAAQTDEPQLAISPIATFNSPWALAFLPGTNRPRHRKAGRLWLVDIGTGAKQEVAGAPRVELSSQGGLLDIVVFTPFRHRPARLPDLCRTVANSGSGLALARGVLVRMAPAPERASS